MRHQIVLVVAKHDKVLVQGQRVQTFELLHLLEMVSLALELLHHLCLSFALQLICSSVDFRVISLGISDRLFFVRLCLGLDLVRVQLSLGDNISLDELGLGVDFIDLQVSFSLDLVDHSRGLLVDFSHDPRLPCLHLLDLLLLLILLLGRHLYFLLPFELPLLLDQLDLFVVVERAELEGLLLNFKSVLELIDGFLFHGLGHVFGQDDVRDDN